MVSIPGFFIEHGPDIVSINMVFAQPSQHTQPLHHQRAILSRVVQVSWVVAHTRLRGFHSQSPKVGRHPTLSSHVHNSPQAAHRPVKHRLYCLLFQDVDKAFTGRPILVPRDGSVPSLMSLGRIHRQDASEIRRGAGPDGVESILMRSHQVREVLGVVPVEVLVEPTTENTCPIAGHCPVVTEYTMAQSPPFMEGATSKVGVRQHLNVSR
jgi:hypothetical protein